MNRISPGAGGHRALATVVGLALLAAGCASHPVSRPAIYAEDPEPGDRIEAARVEAARSGKRVLLNFGANWCSDSRALYHRLTEDPRLVPLVQGRYVMVLIDVGERGGPNWDSETVRRYGRPFAERGIPALVVLDEDGRPISASDPRPLRDSDHRRPRKVARFLERWSRLGSGAGAGTGTGTGTGG